MNGSSQRGGLEGIKQHFDAVLVVFGDFEPLMIREPGDCSQHRNARVSITLCHQHTRERAMGWDEIQTRK